MPRPKAENNKAWHPSYWANSLSLSANQEKKLLRALAESVGLNIRETKDEQTATSMLRSVLALIGSYKGVEGMYNQPREESRRVELRKLETSLNKCLTNLDDLSEAAKRDVLTGQLDLIIEQNPMPGLDVLVKNYQLDDCLEALPAQLENVLVVVRKAIDDLTKTSSGRSGKPRKDLQIIIRQLLNIFQTCAAAGYEESKDDQLKFLQTALKAAGIRPPRDLAHYLPRH